MNRPDRAALVLLGVFCALLGLICVPTVTVVGSVGAAAWVGVVVARQPRLLRRDAGTVRARHAYLAVA